MRALITAALILIPMGASAQTTELTCRDFLASPPARFEAMQRQEFAKLLRSTTKGLPVQKIASCFGRAMRSLQATLTSECLLGEGPSDDEIVNAVERAAELCLPEAVEDLD